MENILNMGLRESVKEKLPVATALDDKEWAEYIDKIKKKGIDFEDLYKLQEDIEKIRLRNLTNNHPQVGD